jgi:hypothetical protein
VATPDERGSAALNAVVPSKKVTVPVGVPVDDPVGGAAVNVNVTVVVTTAGFGVTTRVRTGVCSTT